MAKTTVLSFTCAILLGVGAFVSVAQADVIAQRKVVMKGNNDTAKILVSILKGETTFDGRTVAIAGYSIANDFIALRSLVPQGSTGVSSMGDNSRAKPEIWQDMDGFMAALEQADAAAKKVAATGEANDEAAFKMALGELGNACDACHEKFRAPKK
jgi:cytochrome c556